MWDGPPPVLRAQVWTFWGRGSCRGHALSHYLDVFIFLKSLKISKTAFHNSPHLDGKNILEERHLFVEFIFIQNLGLVQKSIKFYSS